MPNEYTMLGEALTAGMRECPECWETQPVDTEHHCDRCPGCGYTKRDASIHMDHRLCKRYPYFPGERGNV